MATEVGSHPLGMHLEAAEHLGHARGRAAGGGERAREMPSHSACQAPTARSCSWVRLPVSSPAWAWARRAQASASVEPMGLCLCAIVEDPPRPSPAGSATSPTSVWAISTTSSAILPSAPASIASAEPSAATRTREVCHGSGGLGQAELAREARGDGGPVLAVSAVSVPAAPPSWAASRSRAEVTSSSASSTPASQVAAL